MNGTPIYDIKPYLPISTAIRMPEAALPCRRRNIG